MAIISKRSYCSYNFSGFIINNYHSCLCFILNTIRFFCSHIIILFHFFLHYRFLLLHINDTNFAPFGSMIKGAKFMCSLL